MGRAGCGGHLRLELRGEEKGVVRQLDGTRHAVWVHGGDPKASRFQSLPEQRVFLEIAEVLLARFGYCHDPAYKAAGDVSDGFPAEELWVVRVVGDGTDDWDYDAVAGTSSVFGGVGIGNAGGVARKLD